MPEQKSSSLGAVLVSVAVLATFGLTMFAVMWRGVPPGDSSIVIGLIELLKILSVSVVAYWVGSSAGSKRSSDTIRTIAQKATGTQSGETQ
jgi:hypothetical protein